MHACSAHITCIIMYTVMSLYILWTPLGSVTSYASGCLVQRGVTIYQRLIFMKFYDVVRTADSVFTREAFIFGGPTVQLY